MAETEDAPIKRRFKEWLGKGNNQPPPKKPFSLYLGIILVLGIVLMAIGALNGEKEENPGNQNVPPQNKEETADEEQENKGEIGEIEKEMQSRLENMLENISQVDNVTVMVSLEGTGKKVYEKDRTIRQQTTTEEDQEGGTREMEDGTTEEQLVIVRQGDQEEPLLLYKEKPEAKGVLVVADGVDNIEVKEWVVEAVTRVLEIAPHKVSVLPNDQERGE
ncbi:stage III sporulation protein AG [Salibacterium aidingense]|uniref:stage III sporulation protein AG n=1 Tax=Salibacterium aidingense TaxID=384933 RepID=UPI00040AAD10|nr:stage III sporulation protein AG [Salibacterium aidingense]